MDLALCSFDQLYEIAKLNNVYVPHPINRKNLERHIYKSVNLKRVCYRLIIYIKIAVEHDNVIHYSKLLRYIDDNIYKIPNVFFGPIKINFLTTNYYIENVEFESYEVRRINNDTISIMLERKDPFFKCDSDYIEKLLTTIQDTSKNITDKDNILYLSEEKLQKYKFPNEFYFDLCFEKIGRVAF